MELTLRERAMVYLNNHLGLGLPDDPSPEMITAGAQVCLLEELVELAKEINNKPPNPKE